MTRRFHFYHAQTGLLADALVITDHDEAAEDFARINTPVGHVPVEGIFDSLRHRVAVDKLQPGEKADASHVIEWRPPAPSSDHEWDENTKRWRERAAVAAARAARESARAEVAEILREQLPIALLEHSVSGSAETLRRLNEIHGQIAELRR